MHVGEFLESLLQCFLVQSPSHLQKAPPTERPFPQGIVWKHAEAGASETVGGAQSSDKSEDDPLTLKTDLTG